MKKQKMKRIISMFIATLVLVGSIGIPVSAALNAQLVSRAVLSDGRGGYLAQIYANNITHGTASAGESWFQAELRRSNGSTTISARKFFGGASQTFANSPSAVWPFAELTANMR